MAFSSDICFLTANGCCTCEKNCSGKRTCGNPGQCLLIHCIHCSQCATKAVRTIL